MSAFKRGGGIYDPGGETVTRIRFSYSLFFENSDKSNKDLLILQDGAPSKSKEASKKASKELIDKLRIKVEVFNTSLLQELKELQPHNEPGVCSNIMEALLFSFVKTELAPQDLNPVSVRKNQPGNEQHESYTKLSFMERLEMELKSIDL